MSIVERFAIGLLGLALLVALVGAPFWIAKWKQYQLLKDARTPSKIRARLERQRQRDLKDVAKRKKEKIVTAVGRLASCGSYTVDDEYVANWFTRAGYTVEKISTIAGYSHRWNISVNPTDKEIGDLIVK